MLVNTKEMLADAQQKHYGVGLFNAVNPDMARGIIKTAEALHAAIDAGWEAL